MLINRGQTLDELRSKDRNLEDFPVGSFFIPKSIRKNVHIYYRYARIADDIADNSNLSEIQKLNMLNQLESAIQGDTSRIELLDKEAYEAANSIGNLLRRQNLDLRLATDLLVAFRLDSENALYNTWAHLIDYCRFSACPVGRFMLALHGERDASAESDALCISLQLLNHIKDLRYDYINLHRIYVPQDWLNHDKCSADDFSEMKTGANLTITLTRMLNQIDYLLASAENLPKKIQNRGLAAEAKFCLSLAKKLSQRLKNEDPLAHPVKLSRYDWVISGLSSFIYLVRQ